MQCMDAKKSASRYKSNPGIGLNEMSCDSLPAKINSSVLVLLNNNVEAKLSYT